MTAEAAAPETTQEAAGTRCLLTAGVHAAVLEALATGCGKEDAAEAAGVSRSTLYAWLRKGRRDLKAGADTPHAGLAEGIEAAMAQARQTLLKRIRDASQDPKHWQAAAWILERRYPEEFGRDRAELIAMRKEIKEMRREIDGLAGGKG